MTLATTRDPVKTATVTFGLGVHTITLTVDDSKGGTASDTVEVTVQDKAPPTITPPPDVTVSTGSGATSCGVIVSDETLGSATASDNCSGVIVINRSGVPSGNLFPVGTTVITYEAKDGAGNKAAATQNVTVIDKTPPTITGVSASPSVLWPPNHKMVDVTVSYTVADNCGGTTCTLSVASNEPVDGLGDGDMAPDWEIVGPNKVRLRAERAGSGTGHIYTVTITCTDSTGNPSEQAVKVNVPHDRGKK